MFKIGDKVLIPSGMGGVFNAVVRQVLPGGQYVCQIRHKGWPSWDVTVAEKDIKKGW